MNTIIENEINKLIGRFPDEDELKSALDYLDYNANDQTEAKDIRSMLVDWVDEKLCECVDCGKYCLIDTAVQTPYGFFCDEDCMYNYDRNSYDMHAEAKAEYVCGNR